MIKKTLSALAIVLLLQACASHSTYDWGNYEKGLYNYYHKPDKRADAIFALSEHLDRLEQNDQRVPPGLYAELGTYWLENGDIDRALLNYQKEYDAWEESRGLMGAIIKNLSRAHGVDPPGSDLEQRNSDSDNIADRRGRGIA